MIKAPVDICNFFFDGDVYLVACSQPLITKTGEKFIKCHNLKTGEYTLFPSGYKVIVVCPYSSIPDFCCIVRKYIVGDFSYFSFTLKEDVINDR